MIISNSYEVYEKEDTAKYLKSKDRKSSQRILTKGHTEGGIIIDFPNLGLTYNGGWCSATKTR